MDTIFEEWKNRSNTGENVGGFLDEAHGYLSPVLVEKWLAESLGSYGMQVIDNLKNDKRYIEEYPSTLC